VTPQSLEKVGGKMLGDPRAAIRPKKCWEKPAKKVPRDGGSDWKHYNDMNGTSWSGGRF